MKEADNGENNSAYINNAYIIDSGEQDIEMKSSNSTYSSGNVIDLKPEEQNEQPVSTNQSAVLLKFPEA